MKTLARVFFFAAMLVSPAAHAAQPADVRQFSVRCAAFYASAFGVPVALVDAIIQVESGWNPYAVSNKGAEGLMQLMPATAARFGARDRFKIEDNIRGGVAYLAWLMYLFRGDLRLVVAAYNVGESSILLRGLAYSSPEVFDYVTRVANLYRALRAQAKRGPAIVSLPARSGGER